MGLSFSAIPFRAKSSFPKWLWYAAMLALVIPVYLGHFPPAFVASIRYGIYAFSACAYALLALKIYFCDGHTVRELLGITGILFLIAIGTIVSRNRCFLSCFLLVFSAKDIDFGKLCRICFGFFLFTLLLNFLLVAVGVLEDTVFTRWEVINHGTARHSLGFGHPNNFGFWTLLVIFSGLLSYAKTGRRMLPGVVAIGCSLCYFQVSDSKAALLASCAAAVLCILFYWIGPWLSSKKWGVPLFLGLFTLGIAVFLILTLLYREENSFFSLCNRLFSDRLAYSHAGFRDFGPSLFGARVNFRWDPVDSLYAYAPICMGVIPSLLFFGLNLAALYRASKAGRWDIVAVAFAGLLYSTMEYGLMNPVHLPLYALTTRLDAGSSQKPSV